MHNLASAYLQSDRFEEAAVLATERLKIARQAQPAVSAQFASSLVMAGGLLFKTTPFADKRAMGGHYGFATLASTFHSQKLRNRHARMADWAIGIRIPEMCPSLVQAAGSGGNGETIAETH